MMRWIFKGLAALGLLAAVTFWWGPPQPEVPHLERVPPAPVEAEPETDARPEQDAPDAPVQASAPRATETSRAPVPAPVPEPRDPAPEIGEPRLAEEDLVVVERPDFEEGPAGVVAGAGAAAPEATVAEATEDAEGDADEPALAAAPVDVDRAGVLIRRMLDLYAAMRE